MNPDGEEDSEGNKSVDIDCAASRFGGASVMGGTMNKLPEGKEAKNSLGEAIQEGRSGLARWRTSLLGNGEGGGQVLPQIQQA